MTPGVPLRLPLLSQRLVVVTGKGGVGKTTVTAALAYAAAASERRVLAVEVGRGSLGSLLGGIHLGAAPMRVRAGLAAASLQPEALLGGFVAGVLRFRVLARRLLEGTSFQALSAAAAGGAPRVGVRPAHGDRFPAPPLHGARRGGARSPGGGERPASLPLRCALPARAPPAGRCPAHRAPPRARRRARAAPLPFRC